MNTKHLISILALASTLGLLSPVLNAAAGDLDLSFGVDGKVTTDISSRAEHATAVAIQTDGKIVTVGAGTGDFTVVRYNQDGTLDTSFGTGGIVIADLGDPYDDTNDVAIQSDGKIIAAGNAGYGEFALARFNIDGSLDASFDGDGKVTTDFGGGDSALAVAIQEDGKIIAVGVTDNPSTGVYDFAIARYNTNGSLDMTFGTGGKVLTDFGDVDRAEDVLIQADGKIVVVGKVSGIGYDTNFGLARYDVFGNLDPSFGINGKVITDFGEYLGTSWDGASAAALQDDGKIIAAGEGLYRAALARYNIDGTLDTDFDGDGKVTIEFFGESTERAYGVDIQSNNKIVIAGVARSEYDESFAIARFLPDGSLDPGFGVDGKVTTDFGDPDDVGVLCPPARKDCSTDIAWDVAIQDDGNIVAVGGAGIGSPSPYHAIARYIGDLPDILVVQIDIKPYDESNNINPRSRGLLPVAVLTSGDFDALLVDSATVQFGPAGAIDTHGRAHVKDIDNDGDMDLLFHFRTRETGISCGDTEATLTGQTWDGTLISGTDSVNTVSCR